MSNDNADDTRRCPSDRQTILQLTSTLHRLRSLDSTSASCLVQRLLGERDECDATLVDVAEQCCQADERLNSDATLRSSNKALLEALDEGDVVSGMSAVQGGADVSLLYENDFTLVDILMEGLIKKIKIEYKDLSSVATLRSKNAALLDWLEEGRVCLGLFTVLQGAEVSILYENDFKLVDVLMEGLINKISKENKENREYVLTGDEVPIELRECFQAVTNSKNQVLNRMKAIECAVNSRFFRLVQNIRKVTVLHKYALASFHPDVDLELLYQLLTKDQTSVEFNLENKFLHTAFMLSVLHQTPQRLHFAKCPDIAVNVRLTENTSLLHLKNTQPPEVVDRIKNCWGGGELVLPSGFTAFMIACLLNDRDLVEVLLNRPDLVLEATEMIDTLKQPGNLLRRAISTGDMHVHYAVLNEDIEFLKFTLKLVGPAALKCVNSVGENVLHRACGFHQTDMILLLLSKKEMVEIFHPQQLSDEDYREFVNQVSSEVDTGRAMSHFDYLPDRTLFESYHVYEAFVNCLEYDLSAIDKYGRSLLHIITENCLSKFLLLAAARGDADFSRRNVKGQTPLLIAIESESISSADVITELAKMAATRSDIDPNQSIDAFQNLRKKLSDLPLSDFFGIHSGYIWDVDNIVDLFTKRNSKEDKVYLDIKLAEGYLEATIQPTKMPADQKKDLEKDISTCITEIYYEISRELRSFINRPPLEERLEELCSLIRGKYVGYIKGMFTITYEGETIQVTYELREWIKNYTVDLTYERLIEMMGPEWDYLNMIDTVEERLSPEHILHLTHTPPLYLLLLQLDKAENEEEESIALRKLEAFLTFQYITIDTASDVLQGQINLLKYARQFSDTAADLLEAKLKSQVSGVEDTKRNAAVVNYKIDYQQLQNCQLEPYQELESSDQLYEFAKLFCARLNSVTAYRRNAQVDKVSRLMDAMARLLEVDSVCTAICFVNNKFVVSSNFGAHGCDERNRDLVRDHVKEATRQLFVYLADCAAKRKVEHSQRSVEILETVIQWKIERKNLWEKFLNFCGKESIILRSILEYVYSNCNNIFKKIVINESGEVIFKEAFQFIISDYLPKISQISCIKNCAKWIQEALYMICRLTRDIRKLQDAICIKLTTFPKAMLQAFKNDVEILPNIESVHAETDLVVHLASTGCVKQVDQVYVGISKVCCAHCTLFIQSFNNRCFQDIYIATRGSHVSHYSWTIPRYLLDNIDKLAVLLGGNRSELYHSFVNLGPESRIVALKLLENFSMYSLKKGLSARRRNLIDILCGKTSFHSHAELSISQAVSIPENRDNDFDDFTDEENKDIEHEWHIAIQKNNVFEINQLLTHLFNKSHALEIIGALTSENEDLGVESEKLMTSEYNVNSQDPLYLNTALHVAVEELDVALIKRLLRHGASVLVTNKAGKTPGQLLDSVLNKKTSPDGQEIYDIFHPEEAAERKKKEEEEKKKIDDYKESHQFCVTYERLCDIKHDYHYRDHFTQVPVPLNRSLCLDITISSIEYLTIQLLDSKFLVENYRENVRVMQNLLQTISISAWHCRFRDPLGALPGAMWRLMTFLFVAESAKSPSLDRDYLLYTCLIEMMSSCELESWRNRLDEYRSGNHNVDITVPLLHSTLSYIADSLYLNQMERQIMDFVNGEMTHHDEKRSRWLSYLVRIGEALEEASNDLRGMFDDEKVKRTMWIGYRITCGDIAGNILDYISGDSDIYSLDDLAKYWSSQREYISNECNKYSKCLKDPDSLIINLCDVSPPVHEEVIHVPPHFDQPITSILSEYIEYALQVKALCAYNRKNNRQMILGYVFNSQSRHPNDDVIEMCHVILASLTSYLLKVDEFISFIPEDLRNTLSDVIDNSRVLLPSDIMLKIRPEGKFCKEDEEEQFAKYYGNCDRILHTIDYMRAVQYGMALGKSFKVAVREVKGGHTLVLELSSQVQHEVNAIREGIPSLQDE